MVGHAGGRSRRARGGFRALVGLLLAACAWAPCVHLLFKKDVGKYRTDEGLCSNARMLAARRTVEEKDAESAEKQYWRARREPPCKPQ